MKRRSLLLAPVAGLFATALQAAPQPWSARWLKGGFDGTHWWAGLAVSLEPHWKTYWRVPGAGGIAPQIMAEGGNLKSFTVHHPLPRRFDSEAGETIGYANEVVFPIALLPVETSQPVDTAFSAFIGVCDVVCIPAQSTGAITFDPARSASPDQQDIARWQRLVPKPVQAGPIASVQAIEQDATTSLRMALNTGVKDIFVEADAKYYVSAPVIMRGLAVAGVKGAKSPAELKGLDLRITVDTGDWPLEQSLKVV